VQPAALPKLAADAPASPDYAWGRAALLVPRATGADRRGLDLLFADLGRTLDEPLSRDWLS